jgi:hypothetical protein
LPPDVTARLSELSKTALESDDVKAKFAESRFIGMVAIAG